MIKFAAPEDSSDREVEYFLKPVEVFLGAVSVDGEREVEWITVGLAR